MIPKKDMLILSALRTNAREKLTEISKTTQIPISTIFDRLKFYEGRFIKGHTALLDFTQLGYATRAQMLVKTDRSCKEQLRAYLLAHQNVNAVSKISNGFDYIAEIVFVSVKQMEEFIEHLEQKFTIHNLEVHYIVEDLKREGFLANPGMIAAIA